MPTTQQSKKPDVGKDVKEATGATEKAPASGEAQRPGQAPAASPRAAGGRGRPPAGQAPAAPPPLPTVKKRAGATLESKTVLLYGPHGIGKSTLASEWAGGDVFFFDTAGELNDIEVYSERVTDWLAFKQFCWALEQNPGQFKAAAVDTMDMLALYCAQHVRKKLGIVHESDAEWGKGWSMVTEEFASTISKLSSLPGLGLILISHSREVEIKTRTASYHKQEPTLRGGIKEICVNLPDLVLFIDWEDEDERVIRTKPSKYWDAKERGSEPKLPAEIAWPLGVSGYSLLKEAWGA